MEESWIAVDVNQGLPEASYRYPGSKASVAMEKVHGSLAIGTLGYVDVVV